MLHVLKCRSFPYLKCKILKTFSSFSWFFPRENLSSTQFKIFCMVNLLSFQTRNKELESSDEVPKRAKAGKTAWISKRDMDACLFQKNSRPQQIQKLYENCEEIPKLRLLEGFWETDLQKKLCVQKYSDPDMFFRNWKEQILEILQKETEELRKNRKQKKIAKRSEKTVERKKIVTKNELRRQELLKEGMIQNYKNDTTIDLDITEFNEKTDYFVEKFEKYATKEIIPKEEEDVKTTTIERDSEIERRGAGRGKAPRRTHLSPSL